MIHFNIDERYAEELSVESAISRREGLFWSLLIHGALFGLLLSLPTLDILRASPDDRQTNPLEQLTETPPEEEGRFVYIEPVNQARLNELRQQLELSDIDRRAQTPEQSPEPQNPLPFSRGDTSERVVASEPEPPAPPPQPEVLPTEELAEAGSALPEIPSPQPEQQIARNTPPPGPAVRDDAPRRPLTGVLGEAVKNLSRYTQNQTFNNPQGGATEPGSTIDFDSKGVDFGPWLRRFVNQVKRNWFVPLSAMSFRGRVVLQFNIHRDGRITDVTVVRPSEIESFTRAAYNAIIGSNPTEPLPPEYPDEKVLFTVTFFYNEQP